ncbi:MAG: pyridoxamine 5'-phosphate oxidase [Planctomycetota bacterium]
MRRRYTRGSLHEKDIQSDPMVQFRLWLDEAMADEVPDWLEINAMTLSTCDVEGKVTSRMVLLKGIDDGRFWFYTNYDSVKGQQIDSNPNVSLCFYWPHLERQVRVEGVAERCTRERSVAYFQSRPRGSQLGASLSDQSSVIESRELLAERLTDLETQHEGGEIPCPDFWGGYMVEPKRIEFWQGGDARLHDRLSYRREADAWIVERLSP